jgi:hypothetical protein
MVWQAVLLYLEARVARKMTLLPLSFVSIIISLRM